MGQKKSLEGRSLKAHSCTSRNEHYVNTIQQISSIFFTMQHKFDSQKLETKKKKKKGINHQLLLVLFSFLSLKYKIVREQHQSFISSSEYTMGMWCVKTELKLKPCPVFNPKYVPT